MVSLFLAGHARNTALPLSRFAVLPKALAALVLAMALAGCMGRGDGDVTGSVSTDNAASLRAQSEQLGERYARKPGEKTASLSYARVLRALNQQSQAVAVLETASIANPRDNEVLASYGKALADAGRLDQASAVLASAHSPDRPDWRILSAQGTVADQQNNHDDAQRYYRDALQIAPNEPAVLSNLGLSYALSRRLDLAEQTLRSAAALPRADPRVRGNLALVLALEGKFKESEDIASRDLSLADAEANVSYVRQMISQSNSWKQIEKVEKGIGRNRATVGSGQKSG